MHPNFRSAVAVAVASFFFATGAQAVELDKTDVLFTPATDKLKDGSKATKPVVKPVLFESVKGANDSTKLPDTARVDARGGVLI
jgi:hypothetical protein